MASNDCSRNGSPVYHVARSREQRRREEPNARSGDTEWGICNKYRISFTCFRQWNNLPSRTVQSTINISVGKKYIVGYQPAPSNPGPELRPDPEPIWQPKPEPVRPARRSAKLLKASEPLLAYMKSWERPPIVNGRISGRVFTDTKGSKTIGYGHWIPEDQEAQWAAYDPALGGTRELSLAEMEQLFQHDVEHLAENGVRKRIQTPLLQQEYDALVDFVYHRGGGALRDSGLEGYINSKPNGDFNYSIIRDNFMKYAFWFNRTTNQWEYVAGFEKRRKEEINMFQFGAYTLHA